MDQLSGNILAAEATRLFKEARALVPLTRSGKPIPPEIESQITDAPLIYDYIRAQEGKKSEEYRLPEPILHPIYQGDVLVVGLNPNDGPHENIPRLQDGLDHYIRFYRDRFDPSRRFGGRPAGEDRAPDGGKGRRYVIKHYDRVEDLIGPVVGRSQALGTVATYCDAIPWKWKKDGLTRTLKHADWVLASNRVGRILHALKPKVVLTLGAPGETIFGHKMSASPAPARPKYNPDWPVWHVASYHPNARSGEFDAYAEAVRGALREALTLPQP